MSIEAICTWGDGPDILLVFKGDKDIDKRFILYEKPRKRGWKYGYVVKGSTDLTIKEAIHLAKQLIDSAEQALQLEKGFDKEMKKK